ncbi:hypothetical protein CCR75_007834 [Bremia lactucae]|uniref:Uncharacterized protein n=1 Tax=Bremia lactucae TaxID=4779 RepID=A0A976FGY6_BRELC|nr:hypothetical protein CCR75_007834 [Bremia lactucae]
MPSVCLLSAINKSARKYVMIQFILMLALALMAAHPFVGVVAGTINEKHQAASFSEARWFPLEKFMELFTRSKKTIHIEVKPDVSGKSVLVKLFARNPTNPPISGPTNFAWENVPTQLSRLSHHQLSSEVSRLRELVGHHVQKELQDEAVTTILLNHFGIRGLSEYINKAMNFLDLPEPLHWLHSKMLQTWARNDLSPSALAFQMSPNEGTRDHKDFLAFPKLLFKNYLHLRNPNSITARELEYSAAMLECYGNPFPDYSGKVLPEKASSNIYSAVAADLDVIIDDSVDFLNQRNIRTLFVIAFYYAGKFENKDPFEYVKYMSKLFVDDHFTQAAKDSWNAIEASDFDSRMTEFIKMTQMEQTKSLRTMVLRT